MWFCLNFLRAKIATLCGKKSDSPTLFVSFQPQNACPDKVRGSLHEFVFTWEIELRIERSRRMKISFRIETRFRFMYQQSYFSGDFSTYTLKYVNKTSYFANNLYFGQNERRFHSEFHSRVKLCEWMFLITQIKTEWILISPSSASLFCRDTPDTYMELTGQFMILTVRYWQMFL